MSTRLHRRETEAPSSQFQLWGPCPQSGLLLAPGLLQLRGWETPAGCRLAPSPHFISPRHKPRLLCHTAHITVRPVSISPRREWSEQGHVCLAPVVGPHMVGAQEEAPSRRLCSGSCLHRLIHAGSWSTLELRWSPCLTRDPRGWGSPGWSGVPPSPACSVLQPRAQHPFPQRAALYRLAHGSLSVLCWESGRGWPPLSLSSQGGQETPRLPTKDRHLVRTHGWSRLQTTKHQAQRILSGPSVAVSPAIRCPWAGC